MKIVCVGECTIDHYLDLDQKIVGGISLNFAIQARRCGAQSVSLVSAIGNDSGGDRVLEKLKSEDIQIDHVHFRNGATPIQEIILQDRAERVFPPGGYHLGVLDGFTLSAADLDFINLYDVIDAPLFQQIEPLFSQVMKSTRREILRSADFLDLTDYGKNIAKIEEFIPDLDLIFISGNEELAKQIIQDFNSFKGVIVITLGARGSLAVWQGQRYDQPALPVSNLVDSTGCGDAFRAAFTVSFLKDRNIPQALFAGACQAAQVIQHLGAN